MSTTDDRSRAAFEKWASDEGYGIDRNSAPYTDSQNRMGKYTEYDTRRLWEGWQAAATRLAPEPSVWQPAATAPLGRYLLVCNQSNGGRSFIAMRNGIGWWDEWDRMRDPTHWQPLPLPETKGAKCATCNDTGTVPHPVRLVGPQACPDCQHGACPP